MASLIKLLAASVGCGLVLGAGIHVGGNIASSLGEAEEDDFPRVNDDLRAKIDARLARIESRMKEASAATAASQISPHQALPNQSVQNRAWESAFAGIGARIDQQQSEVETIRRQVATAAEALESVRGIAGTLHQAPAESKLETEQLGPEIDRRIAALEQKFFAKLEASRKETAETMLHAVESRVAARISQLENDLGGQAAAVSDLKDCSLRTEQTLQRLIGVLDKVLQNNSDTRKLSVVQGR